MAKKKEKKFDELTKDDAELMSYKDLTYILINEKGKMMTADLFRYIVNKLELPENAFEKQIGDYYTTLSTDKRFLLLQDGEWDLRDKHTSDKIIKASSNFENEDDEEEEEEEDISLDDDMKDKEIDSFDSDDDDEDNYDDDDEDLKDLVVLDEEELELEE